ncbi:MAG: ADP-ribosylglycohydrolase family protein [Clostridia bacterium]|nr:ADP-ribosylglycohydrolase family protein [Clostridia bacterium]
MNRNSIYGAVIGDIVGSYPEVIEMRAKINGDKVTYKERIKYLNPKQKLFSDNLCVTDDTILTVAVADAVLCGGNYAEKIKTYGQNAVAEGFDKYGRNPFGKKFIEWLNGDFEGTSYGNGCAMRISPIGYIFPTLEQTLLASDTATLPTHNTTEAILCARAVAGSIFLARTNHSKHEIEQFVEQTLGIKLDYELADLQENNVFTSRAITSVPQAIYCFLISNNFEDCLRKTLSIGADADTLCAISCSIASAFYGLEDWWIKEADKYIPQQFKVTLEKFSDKFIRSEYENIK